MIIKNDYPHCPTCNMGGRKWQPAGGDSNFQKNLKRFAAVYNNFVKNHMTEWTPDENHEPAWKKRRTSKSSSSRGE